MSDSDDVFSEWMMQENNFFLENERESRTRVHESNIHRSGEELSSTGVPIRNYPDNQLLKNNKETAVENDVKEATSGSGAAKQKKDLVHSILEKRTISNSTIASNTPEGGPSYKNRKKSSPALNPKSDNVNKADKENKVENINNHEVNEEDGGSISEDCVLIGSSFIEKEPEKIIGLTVFNGQRLFLLKWKGTEETELVTSEETNLKYPQLVISFYEERFVLNSPDNEN